MKNHRALIFNLMLVVLVLLGILLVSVVGMSKCRASTTPFMICIIESIKKSSN